MRRRLTVDPAAPWAPWCGRGIVVVSVLAALVTLLGADAGVQRPALAESWQLIDLDVLSDDPLGSVWYLHIQPPLYNLLVGIVGWSSLPLAGTLFVLYGGCLLGIGLLLRHLLVRWGVGPVVAGAVAAVATLNPYLLSNIRIASYEVPICLMIVGLLVAADHYLDTGRPAWLLGVSAAATAGALTRSLLHPAWIAAVLVVLVVARPPGRRVAGAALAVPLLLVGGWMLKNQVVFGEATASSWLGFNMQRGVTGPMVAGDVDRDVAAGAVSDLALETPWRTLDHYAEWSGACTPEHHHPSLTAIAKFRDNVPNFNAECFIGVYDRARDDATELLRRHPGRYLSTRRDAAVFSIGTTTIGPLGSSTWIDDAYRPFHLTTDLVVDARRWNLPLYGPVEMQVPVSRTLGGLLLVVPLRAVVALARLGRAGWSARRTWPSEEVVWLLVALTTGMLVGGGALVEMGENSRFRTSLDPILIALPLGMVARAAGAAWTQARSDEAGARRYRGGPVAGARHRTASRPTDITPP